MDLSATLRRRRPPLLALLFGLCLLPVAALGQEGYRLQPGDSLDLHVAGLPGLDRVMRIENDGSVSVPLAGRIDAAGKTLAEAEAQIAQALSAKVYRQRGADGRESLFAIDAGEVGVAMAEYRPVYVDGGVKSAGAYPYSPGLTVRQAIALAGGYGLDFTGERDPVAQALSLQTLELSLTAQLQATLAQIARLTQELDVAPPADADAAAAEPATPTPEDVAEAGVPGAEQRRLQLDRRSIADQTEYLKKAIAGAQREIDLLSSQVDSERQGEEADQEEYDRVQKLMRGGLVQADRLNEARRAVLTSASRRLETASELAEQRNDLAELQFQLDNLTTAARVQALSDLSAALAQRDELRGRLAGTRRQLQYYGALPDADQATATITVQRPDGSSVKIAEGEDPPLAPGDRVSVELPLPGVP
jgi:polysaccharide export outer membrane protein